jgi:hypothetical protein
MVSCWIIWGVIYTNPRSSIRILCTKPSSFTHNKRPVSALYIKSTYPLKTAVYSVFYELVLNTAIGFCFIPFLLLSWKKMRKVRTYQVIGIYWLFTGLINFTNLDFFRQLTHTSVLQQRLNLYYNLLETPLILLVFAGATSGILRKQLLLILPFFLAGEGILIGRIGYNFNSSAIIIGSGLLLTLTYSIIGLVQYMRKMEHTPFENSMVFVYAALLFAYGSFLIIYIFTHIRGNSEGSSKDSFLLYYTSILLSAAITSTGLWSYGIRRSPVPG